jgi:tellurite resistance protein TehA-like permease
MDSKQIFKRAACVAGLLLFCSLVAYRLLDPNPSAGYVTLPGFLVGIFVATVIAAAKGNAHGVDLTTILVITSLVNFACYLGLTHIVLVVWSKMQNK